jgi:protein TonB
VEAQLDATGNVSRVKIYQSSGHSILDSAALGAVKAWNFEPARKSGQAIKSRVRVPVHFKLT